ncbi:MULTISPECIES: alpha-2-macroglobulin [unclassified Legionella]|uniref:alpha-2-macroglobulin n=1 Tax=unclassified Legionella TaxID=2622702 RepID=UPI001054F2FD|nr:MULTISPECIES: alpha-2-macroglobulin [unclassified Legionella]MDI9818826.1 alpha-2-macroglobulin [Legionella sp. PL877]
MSKKPIYSTISAFFILLFGRLNWTSPPWTVWVRRQAITRPGMFWSSIAGFLLFSTAIGYSYYWYKNLPKPQLITALISAPKPSLVEDDKLKPEPLIINFGISQPQANPENNFTPKSVAPLNQIGQEVHKGVTITPSIEGKWVWDNDSRLIFTPATDWPAGQSYNIHFEKNFFVSDAIMEGHTYSFSTQPFEAKITEFKFYQDPVNAKHREAIATISFNFPVDPGSLENKTSLSLQSIEAKTGVKAQPFKFNLTYDQNKRIAYLHSEPLSLLEVPRYLVITLNEGIKASTGPGKTSTKITKNLFIPDIANYFKVTTATASIVRNEQDRPEQVLALETTLGVTEAQLKKSLHVYLLPQNYPATTYESEKKNYDWQNPGEVTANILTLATPLPLQAIPADRNYATLHSYKFTAQTPRYIYLKLDKGMRGFGDFILSNDYAAIIKVPEYPKEISFIHKGALLALSGEKKLSVLVQGLAAVKFDFARILPANINHLVTQTQGDFNNPYFINQSFNEQNISQIFSEVQQFAASDFTRPQYTALDFAKYLSAATNTGGPQGLFLLQARGWDIENNLPLEDIKANRLILITDLGMIVKDNRNGSHDVFVQSITKGTPVPHVKVTVLGKNGLPLLTYATDEQGHASFPSLSDFVDEREPVVYLANLNDDVSFIPYNNFNRQLNYSRYDVGGLYTNPEQYSLSAYLFSDRGLYRPGDLVHLGAIIKQAYLQPQTPGLMVEATVTDPRGTTIEDHKFTLDATGYLSFDFQTNPDSPTGQYFVNLYLVKDKHPESFLGSTSIRVAEFQPDRMRIKSNFSQGPAEGWISPANLHANIQLWNLYGAPAANRRVGGKILLAPQRVEFNKYPDYIFADPLTSSDKPAKVFSDTLADVKTNEQGEATFDLNLERFDKATYRLTFFAEGFEAESGRSVMTQSTALVSPLPYFIGYKPNGDLNYVKQNSQRNVNFIAVNPQLNQQTVADLRLQLLSLHPITTLVKKPNGTYEYQSVIQTTVINTQPFNVNEQGTDFALPTQQIGDFSVKILDQNNTELSQFKFSIVGDSQQPLAHNAELNIKLNKIEYHAGDDIELQITAPYTGSGLITIERDKLYSVQWFKTSATSSTQRIHIPEDFQGNGYVNVTFVRDWSSPDIFISPLSYSIAAFKVDDEKHNININLNTASLAHPGEPFSIEYSSDKPGKIIIFAVDEGILQVANYAAPDPLAFFFQKKALEVLTQQTVDQILPQFIRERELSAVGGDGGEALLSKHLNPFKRKTDLPVAYWSGIVDTDSTPRQLVYNIPDYFNGTLKVMAVAVADNAVGSRDKKSEIRGNFVINPNVPTFIAPGDIFEISASIANNVTGSGTDAKIAVQLNVTPDLEIIGSANESLTISEGQEKTVRFKLKANASLGSAKVTIIANTEEKSSTMDTTLSIRPATTYITSITSGSSNASKTLPIERRLYPDYRKVDASISSSPLILLPGLQRYLENFPYGCTEQLTSKALPLLAMSRQPWFANEQPQINEKILTTIRLIGQRQMSNGSFSYWPGTGDSYSNNFASVYAMQFLTEAKMQGYNVPGEMFSLGLGYLRDLSAQNPTSLEAARIQAYAIYILTRNEIVTTNYLTNLQLYLENHFPKSWQQDIAGAYIAATYQLLKSDRVANQLIRQYKIRSKDQVSMNFYDNNSANAQYLYLIARHFPDYLPTVGPSLVMQLISAINTEQMNTIFSGYISLALGAYGEVTPMDKAKGFSISELLADNSQKLLATFDNAYGKVSIDEEARQITYDNLNKQTYFYQLIEAGFDKELPEKEIKQGLTIYREYRDSQGNKIKAIPLGSEVEVHIQVRSLDDLYLDNVAIVDLLPGGFEVVQDSVSAESIDYVDIREDRIVFFTSIEPRVRQLHYRIKATNIGEYTVPPIFAESMYNPDLKASSTAGVIEVTSVLTQ